MRGAPGRARRRAARGRAEEGARRGGTGCRCPRRSRLPRLPRLPRRSGGRDGDRRAVSHTRPSRAVRRRADGRHRAVPAMPGSRVPPMRTAHGARFPRFISPSRFHSFAPFRECIDEPRRQPRRRPLRVRDGGRPARVAQ
ncbi:hypothetical protein BURPS668_A0419 [Burkholderia pseudomallei 668]|nr:hypothetical protein BURPS668_A0419 [Burkholderia pseudomallei 668]